MFVALIQKEWFSGIIFFSKYFLKKDNVIIGGDLNLTQGMVEI